MLCRGEGPKEKGGIFLILGLVFYVFFELFNFC